MTVSVESVQSVQPVAALPRQHRHGTPYSVISENRPMMNPSVAAVQLYSAAKWAAC
jgi:hypothetical protein